MSEIPKTPYQKLGLQFGGGQKYQDVSSAHPSDANADITHPHEGGYTANTPQYHPDWDEDKYQSTWGSQDMSGEPDIPTMKPSSYKPAPKWDD